MADASSRPTIPTPIELRPVVQAVARGLQPVELWLFGSRARGDHRPDSDWDILAVLDDDALDAALDPLTAWEIARDLTVPVTLLTTTRSELASIWNLVNTLGYDLAREGVKLRVG